MFLTSGVDIGILTLFIIAIWAPVSSVRPALLAAGDVQCGDANAVCWGEGADAKYG